MNDNKGLNAAIRAKKDEFYTTYEDIEKELSYYEKVFNHVVVYCNCDDPNESQFVKYFFDNMESLKISLVATCYQKGGFGKYATYCYGRLNEQGRLKGDGDFRSQTCIDVLQLADIVVTNPPFSLFREYLALLIQYDKKFLILGNVNSVTCKDIFPLFKEGKVWFGPSIKSGDRKFYVPDDYPMDAATCGIDENGKKFIRVKGVRWFTNLDNSERHKPLVLTKHYGPKDYPKYDNYKAIEVNKTANIPMDYDGVMGVPITFLDKYCPDQFDILGITENNPQNKPYHILGQEKYDRPYLNGKRMYPRILIKHKC